MSMRPVENQQSTTQRVQTTSRLDIAIQAGQCHRQRLEPGKVLTTSVMAPLETLATSGAAMLPRPAQPRRRDTEAVSVVEQLIAARTTQTAAFHESPGDTISNAEPDVETAVVADIERLDLNEMSPKEVTNYQWTTAEKGTQDGTLSPDNTCFAFEGVYHPLPTATEQLACIVTGDLVGKSFEEIRHLDTAWLPVGFSAGQNWHVAHRDGENYWRYAE